MVILSKSRQSLSRRMLATLAIVAVLLFFVFSNYQQVGELQTFGWLGLAAAAAGFLSVGQQYFYFYREPDQIHLDVENGRVLNADTGKELAQFDQVTFFALSTNKTNALIECSLKNEMVMRLKRHYELNMKVSEILTKYSHIEGVELKHIGLTQ